jgi:hypothetical protein
MILIIYKQCALNVTGQKVIELFNALQRFRSYENIFNRINKNNNG